MTHYLKQLQEASRLISEAKQGISAHVQTARLLLKESLIHDLQDVSNKISSDTATIENDLGEYARIGVKSDKFAVSKVAKE